MISTATHVQVWTGEASLGGALEKILSRLPRVERLITTLGARGSVCVARCGSDGGVSRGAAPAAGIGAALDELLAALGHRDSGAPQLACRAVASGGTRVWAPEVASCEAVSSSSGARYSVTVCGAATADDPVQDTTGAGDAFLGATLFSILHNLDVPSAMQFASVVATCKCLSPGARTGLPRLPDFDPPFLQRILLSSDRS